MSAYRIVDLPIGGLETAKVEQAFYQRLTVHSGTSADSLGDAQMHLEDKGFKVMGILPDGDQGWMIVAEKEVDI